jgi:hypothetical protein
MGIPDIKNGKRQYMKLGLQNNVVVTLIENRCITLVLTRKTGNRCIVVHKIMEFYTKGFRVYIYIYM